jgi:Lrp/AsnC family transcriptional regulator
LYRISGAYDYLIDVLAKDIKDFDLFYKNLIENIEIFEVSSSFVMEIMKETTNIPILNEL